MAKDETALYIKRGKRYNYRLKDKDDRANYIEDKLSFIFELSPDVLMGYHDKNRSDNKKYDKIPKMIDAYTTYFLTSRGVSDRVNNEYPYYVNERDEKHKNRIGNRMVNDVNYSIDNSARPIEYKKEYNFEYIADVVASKIAEDSFYDSIYIKDNNVDTDIVEYALSGGKINKNAYKKILAISSDLITNSEDKELIELIEQIIFNCVMVSEGRRDIEILRMYTNGCSYRNIEEKTGIPYSTVRNRIDKLLSWI